MKPIYLSLMALAGQAAAAEPTFYVVALRHNGDAVLHASARNVSAKAGLAYISVDAPVVHCCFHAGRKPGQGTSSVKLDTNASPLTSEQGDETYQIAGYVTAPHEGARDAADKLAFGFDGMRSVSAKTKRTDEIAFANGARPVIVKHCLGAEGVNFRLYHASTDRTPYASYYFALGYDTIPDCE